MFLKTFHGSKCILCVALSLLFSHQALSQADIISGSISTSTTNYSPGTGANRIIVVCIANETNNTVRSVNGITWGGQSLDRAHFYTSGNGTNSDDDLRGEIWYLSEAKINAATSYCNDFVVDWNNTPTTVRFSAFTLKNVNQSGILDDIAANRGRPGNSQ